jgi:hypothetical protein
MKKFRNTLFSLTLRKNFAIDTNFSKTRPTDKVSTKDSPNPVEGAPKNLSENIKKAGKEEADKNELYTDRIGMGESYPGDNTEIQRERFDLKGGAAKASLKEPIISGGNPDFNIDGTALNKEREKKNPNSFGNDFFGGDKIKS